MHIERILLRDVGPFDDVTIEFPKGTDPNLADVYLLTGPNGTGKSTVLYALAAVIASGRRELANNLLVGRMRSANTLVALKSLDGRTFAAANRQMAKIVREHPLLNELEIPHPFGGTRLRARGFGLEPEQNGLYYFDDDPDYLRMSYAQKVSTLSRGEIFDAHRSIAWAAFAYAGIRPVSDVHITAIQAPQGSPFENSLSFLQTADTNLLANWIASQNYRRLKAKEAGDVEDADRLDRSVRCIEKAIAEIIEDPSFGFVITAKDDDVRVRWQGVTVQLGALPDGLQSIVS